MAFGSIEMIIQILWGYPPPMIRGKVQSLLKLNTFSLFVICSQKGSKSMIDPLPQEIRLKIYHFICLTMFHIMLLTGSGKKSLMESLLGTI